MSSCDLFTSFSRPLESLSNNEVARTKPPFGLKLSIPSLELVKDDLERVKELMDSELMSSSGGKRRSEIDRLLESLSHRSGKMLRPGLVLLSGKCFDCITDSHIKIAACVETIHNATLLHDDVIDEGSQRRGKPTINSLWGNESAVLLGDLLLSHVFKLSSELEPEVTQVLADAAVRICEGELRQSETKRGSVSHKRLLYDFGLNAGIAFQIADDLLDIIGDEKRTGKTKGCDADKHKPTLAIIHLLRTVESEKRNELIESFLEGDKSFIERLEEHGSLAYAAAQAKEYTSKAIRSLSDSNGLTNSNAKNALIETARFMADRVR
ncbi:MAG: polyprenyl synthetase family protein [Sedimentisphaerales bacterium]